MTLRKYRLPFLGALSAGAVVVAMVVSGGLLPTRLAWAACTVSITGHPSDPSVVTTPTFTFTSAGCLHPAYNCKVDSGSYASCSSPKTLSSQSNTAHTFYVKEVNSGVTASYAWHVDTVAPTPVATSATGNEDAGITVSLSATDPDTPPSVSWLLFSPGLNPSNGTLGSFSTTSCVSDGGSGSTCTGNVVYTPNANFYGTDNFYYKASDTFRSGGLASASITINAVNDAPSFSKGADKTVNENAGAQTFANWATALSVGPTNEQSSQSLDFNNGLVWVENTSLFSAQPALTPTGTTATLTFTPATNANGSTTVHAKIHDNGGTANGGVDTSAEQTFTITIAAVAPTATADSYSTYESTLLDVPFPGILGNDTPSSGNPLTAVVVATPSHGKLVLQASGAFAYTPNDAFTGSDSYTYHAAFGSLTSSDVTVSLSVLALSTADSATTSTNTPITKNVLANDNAIFASTPTEEAHYCYDGFDAACGGSDSSDARNTSGRLSRVTDKSGLTILSYDSSGRATVTSQTIGSGSALVTTTTLDANGNATAIAYPSGITVSQTFDETDRQSLITWSGGGSATLTTSMTWFPYGGLSSWASNGTHPVTMTVTEDTGGWITQVAASATPSPTAVSYAYANDGNVKAIPSPASTPNELHDSLSRLISDRGRTRHYDDAGNVTSNGFALSYPLATSDRWSSADAGAISYVFDSAGNATQRGSIGLLTGDDGTVIAIDNATWGRTAELRDHRNLRVMRAGAAGDETYLYSPAGELVQRTGATVSVACGGAGLAQTSTPVENYVYAGGRRIGMVRATITGTCGGGSGTTLTAEGGFLYFADKMDLAAAIYRVSDGAQVWTASFDAFGVPLARNEDADADGKSIHNDFELPGQLALSAVEGGPFVSSTGGGLVENWNRIYDSEVGRYLEVDPRGQSADLASYVYAQNGPLVSVDPSGADIQVDGDNIWIDVWDDCCTRKLSRTGYRFGGNPAFNWEYQRIGRTGYVHIFFPPGQQPGTYQPPTTLGPEYYCTSCEQDKRALAAAGAAAQNPPNYVPNWWPQAGIRQGISPREFINGIIGAAGFGGGPCNSPSPAVAPIRP